MKIDDNGFIIYTKKYGENSLIIKVLSKNNGIISGYLTKTKYNKSYIQIGNLVQFTWFAKSIAQLGSIKIELIKSYTSSIISNIFFLLIIENIIVLINNLLLDNYLPDINLFLSIESVLNAIVQNYDKKNIIRKYFLFENTLLNQLDGGIIFDIENTNDLYYISTKTGLAVSKKIGDPYKNKLLIFPTIFKTDDVKNDDVNNCFIVVDFFLRRNIREFNDYKREIIINTREKLKKQFIDNKS
jgi:DNA repair protein RecO (recombination protein O)